MRRLQKLGGIAALVQTAAYIAAFAIFFFLVDAPNRPTPVEKVQILIQNRSALYAGAMIAYLLTGFGLIALVAALHQRLNHRTPTLMQLATPLGFIWAGLILASGMIFMVGSEAVIALYSSDPERAGSLWLAIAVVQNGLGGGVEVVAGVWVLLISLAGRQSSGLPALLSYAGLLAGIVGVLTIVPALDGAVDLFGVAMIIWFASLGVVLLRTPALDRPAPR
ncbi:MAG: DUF4386 family protein [Sphingomonadaceae bacterium]|nr:DUF4386 family protein [Sphingomonadaceae bacterium]